MLNIRILYKRNEERGSANLFAKIKNTMKNYFLVAKVRSSRE